MDILSLFPEINFENIIINRPGPFSSTYPKKYAKIIKIFREMTEKNEISERVFQLTHHILQETPSNLTVFKTRRDCIKQLKKNPIEELAYIEPYAMANIKSYQIYEHRRQMIELINKPLDEIKFINKILELDNKNYHVWLYRKYLCQKFNLYEEELQKTEFYIQEDIMNNSAWNYRYFIQENNPNFDFDTDYIIEKINLMPENESTWNYLNGFFIQRDLLNLKKINQSQKKLMVHKYEDYGLVEYLCSQIISNQPEIARFAYTTQIFILIEKNEYQFAIQYLMNEIDSIRMDFWQTVINIIKSL